MGKRFRAPVPKPGELKASYGRVDGMEAVFYTSGGGGVTMADSRVLMNAFEGGAVFGDRTLVEELDSRGYDITTLRFTIQLRGPND